MNVTQRRVHANAWTVLGVLLLMMLAVGIASRPAGAEADAESASTHPTP